MLIKLRILRYQHFLLFNIRGKLWNELTAIKATMKSAKAT